MAETWAGQGVVMRMAWSSGLVAVAVGFDVKLACGMSVVHGAGPLVRSLNWGARAGRRCGDGTA